MFDIWEESLEAGMVWGMPVFGLCLLFGVPHPFWFLSITFISALLARAIRLREKARCLHQYELIEPNPHQVEIARINRALCDLDQIKDSLKDIRYPNPSIDRAIVHVLRATEKINRHKLRKEREYEISWKAAKAFVTLHAPEANCYLNRGTWFVVLSPIQSNPGVWAQTAEEAWLKAEKQVKKPMNVIDRFDGPNRFLSNFYDENVEVEFEGMTFRCTENAYQASKTLDLEMRKNFQQCTPFQAKKWGKPGAKINGVPVVFREDWKQVNIEIMRGLVMQKFSRHETMKAKLLATDNTELIEGNTWRDTFWGVCDGKGENHLGKILMEVREALRNEI